MYLPSRRKDWTYRGKPVSAGQASPVDIALTVGKRREQVIVATRRLSIDPDTNANGTRRSPIRQVNGSTSRANMFSGEHGVTPTSRKRLRVVARASSGAQERTYGAR